MSERQYINPATPDDELDVATRLMSVIANTAVLLGYTVVLPRMEGMDQVPYIALVEPEHADELADRLEPLATKWGALTEEELPDGE